MTEQTPMERLAENAEMNPIGLGHHGLCIVLKADVRSVLSDLTRLTAENERLRGAIIKAEFTAYPAHGTGWVVHVTNHELTADAEALADPGAPGGEGDNV